MAMGMDYAWHRGQDARPPESTETRPASPTAHERAAAGPERRTSASENGWRGLYAFARATVAQQRVAIEGLRHTIRMRGKTIQRLQNRLARKNRKLDWRRHNFDDYVARARAHTGAAFRKKDFEVACLRADLTQAQIINAGHASWRRDAEAEYESVRRKLDEHFLLPHLTAIDMAAALAKVRPVGSPPFDLVDGVRQVVHELLHLREWKRRARERSVEVERLRAERDEATCAEMARLRARLEATIEDTIETWPEDMYNAPGSQCTACQREAESPEAIRHVAGTRIGERACQYLLTARALGRLVLDDSEEVEA